MLVVAIGGALAGCEGKVRDIEAEGAAATAPVSDAEGAALRCSSGDEIDERERDRLVQHGQRLLRAIRGGALDAVWADLQPEMMKPDLRPRFMEAIGNVAARLSNSVGDPTVEQVRLVRVLPGVREQLKIACGTKTADPSDDIHITTHVDGRDMAFVVLRVPGNPYDEGVTFQMRRNDGQWYLVSVHANPVAYRGRTAEQYAAMADTLAASRKATVAYLVYGVAQSLAARGASIVSPIKKSIDEKIGALAKDPELQRTSDQWTVGDTSFPIHGVSLTSTSEDISPLVRYVTSTPLTDEAAVSAEARRVAAELERRHPELADIFKVAVIDAYAEAPTDPGRTYDTARIEVYFGDGKAVAEH